MIQCNNNCACKPVCKEVDNWKKYCEDHIRLRERSVLFDSEPSCPYYINKGCVANLIVDIGKGIIHNKEGSKTIIDDSPYNPEKQKNNDILSTALKEFNKYSFISFDTMDRIIFTGDRELISLLADQSTFVKRANELLKKRKVSQENKDIYGVVTTQQALDAVDEHMKKYVKTYQRNILNE